MEYNPSDGSTTFNYYGVPNAGSAIADAVISDSRIVGEGVWYEVAQQVFTALEPPCLR